MDGVHPYVNQCPHHWLAMNRADGRFLKRSEHEVMCAHHSAVFSLVQDGICIMGPCQGSNLIGAPVEIIEGQVLLAPAWLKQKLGFYSPRSSLFNTSEVIALIPTGMDSSSARKVGL